MQENRSSFDQKEQTLHQQSLEKQEQIQDLTSTVNKLKAKAESLESQIRELNDKLARSTQDCGVKQKELQSLHETQSNLYKQLDTLKGEKERLDKQVNYTCSQILQILSLKMEICTVKN